MTHQTMRHRRSTAARRRGSLVPAVAVALLVVGGTMALVFDRLWIDAARIELLTAAEAAALAGAAELADDGLLLEFPDASERNDNALEAALRAAAGNTVAGQPVSLRESDVRIGRIVQDPAGRDVFLETDDAPTSIAVFAGRQRSGPNPVSLYLRDESTGGQPDVTVVAEAGIDNHVIGIAAITGGCVPALPLAALESDATGTQTETWVAAIEQRGGGDRFRYDEQTGLVIEAPDGLPELTLLSASASDSPSEAAKSNIRLLDLGVGLRDDRCAEQVLRGLTLDHLVDFGGDVRFDAGPLSVRCDPSIGPDTQDACATIVGQPRICFLFAADAQQPDTATVPRIVAGRIMSVRLVDGDRLEIVVQPCVVSTRTAMLGDETTPLNPYIYKLQLTH